MSISQLKPSEVAQKLRSEVLEETEFDGRRVKVRIFEMEKLVKYILEIYRLGRVHGSESEIIKCVQLLKQRKNNKQSYAR